MTILFEHLIFHIFKLNFLIVVNKCKVLLTGTWTITDRDIVISHIDTDKVKDMDKDKNGQEHGH